MGILRFAIVLGGLVLLQEKLPEGEGLAAKYPEDVGLAADPNVLHFWDYEDSESWKKGWSGLAQYSHTSQSSHVFQGHGALAATKSGGGILKLKEGESCLYQRWYQQFSTDFDMPDGMKFHGFAGIGPGRAENYPSIAGIRPDGTDKLYGIVCIIGKSFCNGLYYYHPDQKGTYGDGKSFGKKFEKGRWYCFEIMMKVNQIGKSDGELACWLDGKLEEHVTGLRWRTSEQLQINLVLDHTYNGGTFQGSIFFDNRVIARKYIGPMRHLPKKGK